MERENTCTLTAIEIMSIRKILDCFKQSLKISQLFCKFIDLKINKLIDKQYRNIAELINELKQLPNEVSAYLEKKLNEILEKERNDGLTPEEQNKKTTLEASKKEVNPETGGTFFIYFENCLIKVVNRINKLSSSKNFISDLESLKSKINTLITSKIDNLSELSYEINNINSLLNITKEDPKLSYNLGCKFAEIAEKEGIQQNKCEKLRKASYWSFFNSFNCGDVRAISELGYCYLYGYGVPQDKIEAKKIFEMGARVNELTCLYNLGCMYLEGDGVTQDYNEAMSFFRKAATAGSEQAMEVCIELAKRLGRLELINSDDVIVEMEDDTTPNNDNAADSIPSEDDIERATEELDQKMSIGIEGDKKSK